ncbi:alpha-L-fucosidase [Flagellimonas marina]|uniref:alpha-L-fucosidase n=1 Tax=Flagellimonas marina TaxID=1775168 RepID=A0ABV8PPV8_9FLAO
MVQKSLSISLLVAALCCGTMQAQNYVPTKENLENREWFQDAKFGMFIHWGIYSVLGVHEWVMETQSIDKKTYEKIAPFFNPTAFDAESWVLLAKSAGMKYITVTSKHHDGFAMFDSKLTDWDIMDRTVYKKDVLKQLAEACRKHGLKLFFYYSQLDWNHPDYYPRGETGNKTGRPDEGDWEKYLDFMNGQLTELLTNYGDVAGIWFDGWWDKKEANWELRKTYDLIHSLQPQALIGSNHHQAPMDGEDFQMFEKDLPGENKGGFSAEAKIGKLPLETAETMAHRWGFSLQDRAYKSTKELIHYLVKAAGHNSNFLLNVGPMPNGKIQPEFVDTLKIIGEWTSKNGETIYGTRGGPVPPQTWGVTTQKNNSAFVHILDWKSNSFLLPNFSGTITSLVDFNSKKPLEYESTAFGTLIQLPDKWSGEMDYIIEVSIK